MTQITKAFEAGYNFKTEVAREACKKAYATEYAQGYVYQTNFPRESEKTIVKLWEELGLEVLVNETAFLVINGVAVVNPGDKALLTRAKQSKLETEN